MVNNGVDSLFACFVCEEHILFLQHAIRSIPFRFLMWAEQTCAIVLGCQIESSENVLQKTYKPCIDFVVNLLFKFILFRLKSMTYKLRRCAVAMHNIYDIHNIILVTNWNISCEYWNQFFFFVFYFQADLIDAINSDCEGDGFLHGLNDDDLTPTASRYLNSVPEMYVTSLSEDVCDNSKAPSLISSPIHKHFSAMNHLQDDLKSININYEQSFLLLDGREELRVPSAELFIKRLGCGKDARVKVVSIFGNTGDGKSHTMNHVFFNGEDIFQTSAAQDSCTLGVWAAYQPTLGVLCLDTEGLLGTTTNENQRMRLLLKVLAISDIVIFRTRSERLHSDMFTFLGTASKAFCKHFSTALQSIGLPGSATSLGPSVLIFHETRNTTVITSSMWRCQFSFLSPPFSLAILDYSIEACFA